MTTKRKQYTTPRLTVHGDVAKLTQQPDHGGSGCDNSVKDCSSTDGNSRLGQPSLS